MDSKDVVKQLLETFFEHMELKSYTIHDKLGLSTVTLRFGNTKENSPSTPVTFIQKKKYHQDRDKARSEQYRRSNRIRKKTQLFDANINVEQMRDECDTMLSTPAPISPDMVEVTNSASSSSSLDPQAIPFCMGSSPELPCVKPVNTSVLISQDSSNSVVNHRMPPVLPCEFTNFKIEDIPNYYEFFVTPEDMGETELFEKRFDLFIPQCLDSDKFKKHMGSVKWLWPAIKCLNCRKGILDLMKDGGTRMRFNPQCVNYVAYLCEICLPDEPEGVPCGSGHPGTYEFIT